MADNIIVYLNQNSLSHNVCGKPEHAEYSIGHS